MNVLLLHNYYQLHGGEETIVNSEQRLLEMNGHNVRRLTFDNHDLQPGVRGLAVVAQSLCNTKSYLETKRVLNEFKPEVMHVHNTFYVASPAVYFAARDCGVPVVQSIHNFRLICPSVYLMHDGKIYEDNINKLFPIRAIAKHVTQDSLFHTFLISAITATHKLVGTYRKLIDRYVVNTEFTQSVYLRSSLGVPEKKFAVKPNFIFDPGWEPKNREDYFVFVGRLSSEKGIHVLLDAAETTGIPLRIIGGGPLESDVQAVADRLPNVEYLGRLERPQVMDNLRRCRALIFPSLWYEGMPLVIIEALATGTPVVVSNLGNSAQMIQHDVSGLHFEPGNVNDLSEQIERVQADQDFRDSLHQGARRAYEENYSPESNYRTLLSIYESVSRTKA